MGHKINLAVLALRQPSETLWVKTSLNSITKAAFCSIVLRSVARVAQIEILNILTQTLASQHHTKIMHDSVAPLPFLGVGPVPISSQPCLV